MLSLPHANHECVKPGFAIESYSVDKPINFYSKRHVFEHNAWFTFCEVFRMSVIYEIR